MSVTIELRGLRLHGRHGVYPHEKEQGQDFVFDVQLDVGERGLSDRLEDAVDYREVVACVREVSDGRRFHLLEALAAAAAEAVVTRFDRVASARVRVRKPDVELEVPVSWSSASATRRSSP